jgi:hypothetical protein
MSNPTKKLRLARTQTVVPFELERNPRFKAMEQLNYFVGIKEMLKKSICCTLEV